MNQGPKSVFSTSSRSMKYITAAGLFYSTLTLGVSSTILNTTVLTFSHRLNTSIENVSKVFIVVLLSYLTSALSCGFIFKFVNRQVCVVALLSLMSTGLFLVPCSTSLTTFLISSSILGLGGGGYDTAQMAWTIDIWRQEAPPFILSQNFAYSLGTLIPPLLLAPYLRNELPNATFTTDQASEPEIFVPFATAGSLVFVAVLIHIILYYVFKYRKISEVENNNQIMRALLGEDMGATQHFPIRKIYLIGLTCCIVGFYCGMEQTTTQFLPTFAHFSPVNLTEAEGARVLLSLQVGYAIGRLFGICLVLQIPPHHIFSGNLVLLILSNTIFLTLAGSSRMWLWIGSVTIGFGMSTVYPSVYAYVGKHVFVTNGIAATISVSGALVASIYPVIVGRSVETKPTIVPYVNFVSIIVCTAAFVTLICTTKSKSRVSGYVKL